MKLRTVVNELACDAIWPARQELLNANVLLTPEYGSTTSDDMLFVRLCRLEDWEIESYIDNFKPYDKAGAYGVQEWIGHVGISRIEGSFYNVMGLPVHRIWQELKKFL